MKKLLTTIAAITGTVLLAAEVNVHGTFTRTQKNGLPEAWYVNGWQGYKPAPEFKILTENGTKILHFTSIKAKYGFGWASTVHFPAKAGDKVTVTAKAKGSGVAWFGIQSFLANDNWTGVLPAKSFTLTPEWKEVKFEFPVTDVKNKITGKVMLTFGANKDSELYISDIKADCAAQ